MSCINKTMLLGHVVSIPELKISRNQPVLSFTLATLESIFKGGVASAHQEFHRIMMHGTLAESAKKLLAPEQYVYLEGSIRTTAFTDEAGIRRYQTNIIAHRFELMDKTGSIKGSLAKQQVMNT